MTDIRRVVGPPGTGKTSYVERQCRLAVQAHGSDGVVVCSLTKAAAAEAAGRSTGVEPERVGTIHALCYRALGRPKLVAGPLVKEWNEANPDLAISGLGGNINERLDPPGELGDVSTDSGDALLQRMDLLRAQRAPRDTWPQDVLNFATRWHEFKDEQEAVDFSDLIEQGLEQLPWAPGRPGALFVDEAQDLSKLELDLIRKWSAATDTTVVVGDPGQCLYSWRGAAPDVFDGGIHKVLEQSFRVPRAVHAAAVNVLRLSGDWREDVVYQPRDAEGEFTRWQPYGRGASQEGTTWRDPRKVLELAAECEEPFELEDGRKIPSLMVLATAEYMLGPIKKLLREAAIPYHNPFTSRWNPISPQARKKVAAMLHLCRPELGGPPRTSTDGAFWTPDMVREFAGVLATAHGLEDESGAVLRGRRRMLENVHDEVDRQELAHLVLSSLTPAAIAALEDGNVQWLESRLKPDAKSVGYLLRVVARRGWRALETEPGVVLSTVHGCKGGQSQSVVMFPDVAPAAWRQFLVPGWGHRDAVLRTLYVGATRARERLVIAAAAGSTAPRVWS